MTLSVLIDTEFDTDDFDIHAKPIEDNTFTQMDDLQDLETVFFFCIRTTC